MSSCRHQWEGDEMLTKYTGGRMQKQRNTAYYTATAIVRVNSDNFVLPFRNSAVDLISVDACCPVKRHNMCVRNGIRRYAAWKLPVWS
jgi:hypothetical protein